MNEITAIIYNAIKLNKGPVCFEDYASGLYPANQLFNDLHRAYHTFLYVGADSAEIEGLQKYLTERINLDELNAQVLKDLAQCNAISETDAENHRYVEHGRNFSNGKG